MKCFVKEIKYVHTFDQCSRNLTTALDNLLPGRHHLCPLRNNYKSKKFNYAFLIRSHPRSLDTKCWGSSKQNNYTINKYAKRQIYID